MHYRQFCIKIQFNVEIKFRWNVILQSHVEKKRESELQEGPATLKNFH
jgi:hypothetical protein